MSKSVQLYGASWCPFCTAAKSWLEKNSISFEYKDADLDGVRDEMKKFAPDNETIPVVVIDGKGYVNPELKQLANLLGVEDKNDSTLHDLLVIGAGPAALSAAIYTTREDLDTVLIEKGVIGGLAAITDQVDNYPGFPDGVTGMDLAESLEKQAVRFGTKFEYAEVTAIENRDGYKRVVTSGGEMFAKAVLVATGSDWKKLGIPGESEFYGRGVHYCATCDGPVYRDKRLVVVGGGNSAIQEAIFLTKFASHIDILVRGESLRASEVLQHELPQHADKITLHYNTKPLEIVGEAGKLVQKVTAETDGKQVAFDCDGVFVFIGLQPTTGFLKHSLELDEFGFVKTNDELETTMEGVFAAGDVRSGATMQIASAVGEGATAALKIREYLKDHHKVS
jgi:thioredoxin reductase (NADPH)